MKSNLLISVVTISYNQGKYLNQCIDSILNQDYENWELFIVDPGSTDNSRKIASEYAKRDERITCIFEPDSGPADGLNKGLENCTGDIFCYLNSDDMFIVGAFSNVVKHFEENFFADCIYSHGLILKSGKYVVQTSDKFSVSRYFSGRGLVLQQSTFFNLRSLNDKLVKFNPMNRTSWDGEFILDLASKGGIFKKVFGFWGVFRIYPESITGSQRLEISYGLDHERIMKTKMLEGFRLNFFIKIFGKTRLYSLYRRFRNKFIFLRLILFESKLRLNISILIFPRE